MISPHFSEGELVAGLPVGTVVPASVRANAVQLAGLLEQVRSALGVPLQVTSWYRTPDHNAEVGGVSRSQHLLGSAADVVPVGLMLGDAYDRFAAAVKDGRVGPFGQAIFYPVKGHIHLSTRVGTNAANAVLVAYPNAAGGTDYHTDERFYTDELPRGASTLVSVVGPVLGFLLLLFLLWALAR